MTDLWGKKQKDLPLCPHRCGVQKSMARTKTEKTLYTASQWEVLSEALCETIQFGSVKKYSHEEKCWLHLSLCVLWVLKISFDKLQVDSIDVDVMSKFRQQYRDILKCNITKLWNSDRGHGYPTPPPPYRVLTKGVNVLPGLGFHHFPGQLLPPLSQLVVYDWLFQPSPVLNMWKSLNQTCSPAVPPMM